MYNTTHTSYRLQYVAKKTVSNQVTRQKLTRVRTVSAIVKRNA